MHTKGQLWEFKKKVGQKPPNLGREAMDNEELLEPQFESTGPWGFGVCWGQLPFKNKCVFLLESEFCVA